MQALILLTIVGTALAVPQPRIVGGENATIESYPFMSNLQELKNGIEFVHMCGGLLITNRAVLTAAHCVYFQSPRHYRVVLGSSFRSSGGSHHFVTRIVSHPDYVSGSSDADVALPRLANSAVMSSAVATVPIVSSSSQLPVGLPVTVLGWGHTEFDDSDFSQQLQEAQVYIVDQQLCAERFAPSVITPGMACAGVLDVGGKDACHYDSGGPYIFSGNPNVFVGVVSWGAGCADGYYPGVMARVSKYSDWIVESA